MEVTLLLDLARGGDIDAKHRLVALVYDELRRIAGRLMASERCDHTLTKTAVVHEALIRLLDGDTIGLATDRAYLLSTSVRVMRHVLVDHARRRAAERRGGGWE